jgi:hypothetical protein
MAQKTIGTQLYIIDKEASGGAEILEIECAVSISGIGGSREQIDITCLKDMARRSESGMVTPEQLTLSIQPDSRNASHVRLYDLYVEGTKFDMAIGFGIASGTDAPTLGSDEKFDFPDTRDFLEMEESYVSNFPFNFEINNVITAEVTFQLSGLPIWYKKETA